MHHCTIHLLHTTRCIRRAQWRIMARPRPEPVRIELFHFIHVHVPTRYTIEASCGRPGIHFDDELVAEMRQCGVISPTIGKICEISTFVHTNSIIVPAMGCSGNGMLTNRFGSILRNPIRNRYCVFRSTMGKMDDFGFGIMLVFGAFRF